MSPFSFKPPDTQDYCAVFVQFLCSSPKTEPKTTQATSNENKTILCSSCAVFESVQKLVCKDFDSSDIRRHCPYYAGVLIIGMLLIAVVSIIHMCNKYNGDGQLRKTPLYEAWIKSTLYLIRGRNRTRRPSGGLAR